MGKSLEEEMIKKSQEAKKQKQTNGILSHRRYRVLSSQDNSKLQENKIHECRAPVRGLISEYKKKAPKFLGSYHKQTKTTNNKAQTKTGNNGQRNCEQNPPKPKALHYLNHILSAL